MDELDLFWVFEAVVIYLYELLWRWCPTHTVVFQGFDVGFDPVFLHEFLEFCSVWCFSEYDLTERVDPVRSMDEDFVGLCWCVEENCLLLLSVEVDGDALVHGFSPK